jgi:hypothetical protein
MMTGPNEPEHLPLAIFFQPGLIFVSKVWSLTHKYKTRLERLAKVKCSCFFGLLISDEEKRFYDIGNRRLNPWRENP